MRKTLYVVGAIFLSAAFASCMGNGRGMMGSNSRMHCPGWSDYFDGRCSAAAERNCPAGYERSGEFCIGARPEASACPAGYREQEGRCIGQPAESCPPGFILEDEQCVTDQFAWDAGDQCFDEDRDGWPVGPQCPENLPRDCDDQNTEVNPGEKDYCDQQDFENSRDKNCDRALDCLDPCGDYNKNGAPDCRECPDADANLIPDCQENPVLLCLDRDGDGFYACPGVSSWQLSDCDDDDPQKNPLLKNCP